MCAIPHKCLLGFTDKMSLYGNGNSKKCKTVIIIFKSYKDLPTRLIEMVKLKIKNPGFIKILTKYLDFRRFADLQIYVAEK